jgi:hypothetical protein
LTPLHVLGAFGFDHVHRHAQTDLAVDRPAARGLLPIVVLGRDLVAEEPRRTGAGVGDQRLVLGQLQLEILSQELAEATFDLLGFGLRPGEPEQDVVGVSHVPQPPVARILGIMTREATLLLAQYPHRGMIATDASFGERVLHPLVLRIVSPEHPSVVSRYQDRLDKRVQPV